MFQEAIKSFVFTYTIHVTFYIWKFQVQIIKVIFYHYRGNYVVHYNMFSLILTDCIMNNMKNATITNVIFLETG